MVYLINSLFPFPVIPPELGHQLTVTGGFSFIAEAGKFIVLLMFNKAVVYVDLFNQVNAE